MMRENKSTEKIGVSTTITTIISLNPKLTPNCPVTKCDSCHIASNMQCNPGVIKQDIIPEKESIVSWDKYKVGYFVSSDQLNVITPVSFKSGYSHEGPHLHFNRGTIFEMQQLA